MPNHHHLTVIFSSLNLTEVHLVQVFLAGQGYQSTIRGEHRVALAGEVPMDDARIELLVEPNHALLAESIIRSHLDGKLSDWTCNACHESNPGSFEYCWQCTHPFPQ